MEEFVIGLSGQLLTDETIKNIQKGLSTIEEQLNHSMDGALNIEGDLEYNKTQKNIQEALNEMAKSLNFDIGDNALSTITKALQEIGKAMAQVSNVSSDNSVVNNLNKQANAIENVRGQYGKLTKTVERYKGVISETPESVTKTYQNGFVTTAETTYKDANQDDSIVRTENIEAQRKELVKAKAAANDYLSELDKIQKTYLGFTNSKGENVQATNPIANADHLAEGKALYDSIIKSVEELRSKTGVAFTESSSKIKEQVKELNNLLGSYYKLEKSGNKMRNYSVAVQRDSQIEDLNQLSTHWQQLGITSDTALKKEIDGFKTVGEAIQGFKEKLSGIGDTDKQGLLNILDNVKLFEGQVKTLIEENALARFAENTKSAFDLLGADIKEVSRDISNSEFGNADQLKGFQEQLAAITSEYDAFIKEIAAKTNQGQDSEALKEMANQIKAKTEEITKRLNDTKASFKQFKETAKDALSDKTFQLNKSTLSNQIKIWLNENTAASERTRDAMRNLQKQIETANKSDLKLLKKQFTDLKREATATGDVGKSFFDTLKSNIAKFTGWYGIGNAISSIRREIVGAVSDLKEMDTLLTEISKTSDRTEIELQELGQSAYSAASGYGRTVQDYLSGVLEMSRAGYSNSEAMAELSLKAQSAGDMTAELANQYLIATDAAYQLKGSEEELSNILDSQNFLTNRNAVSMTELAEATKIAASQSASAGVGIDEMTAAIGTMIATTQQSGSQIARAWRAVLMSIRQTKGTVDEETGEIIDAEKLSKAEKAANALGVSLKEIKDGTLALRDPITVLRELSEAYNQLDESDTRRANLLNDVAGKFRSNAFDALLKNFDTYDKMLQEFSEGTGSAAEEAEKTANSWEGSMNKFNNSVTELVNNFVNSGNAKSVINFFTGLIKLVDGTTSAFGSLGSAVGIFSGIMISKAKSIHFSFDKDTQSIKLGEKALYQLADATRFQTIKAAALTVGMKALNAVINIGTSLIIGGIVSAISSWINREEELEQKHQEFLQGLQETNEEYKEVAKSAEDYLSTYKEILSKDEMTEEDRTKLLEIQNSILETYGEQARGIDLVNGKYQEQLDILSQIAQGEYQKQAITATQLIDEAIADANDSANRILSYAYNKIDNYSRNQLKFRVGEEDYSSTDESGIAQAKEYISLLEDIKGLETDALADDVFSKYGKKTFTLGVDSNLTAAETVDALTEALQRLYNIPRTERGTMFENIESRLQELLKQAQEKVTNLNKLFNENINALVGRVTSTTGVNWSNVTDETFKEWYNAILEFYNADQYSEEYQQAIIDWFNRNYTSVAQRLARGTSITDIAYESEKAFKAAMSSDNGVFGFSYEAYKEDIDAVTKEFKTLQSVIDKIDSGKYSVIEDGFGLLDSYPDLLQYINNTDKLKEKLVELQTASPKELVSSLQEVRANLEKVGNYKQIAQIDALITALETLGDTAEETAEALTAKDYLKIQQDGIDKIVEKLTDEKEALNDTLDTLNDRKSEIEDYYDAQINALKEENEEREKNIELQEKQKALDDAKRNKVRVYSAARGFTIQEDSEAVAKAQQDLDNAIKDNQIDELEKQKEVAVKSIEDEIAAQKKDIKSKEDEIEEWKDYKTQLTDETNAIIDQNAAYLEAQKQFVLDENSTFTDRENNLKAHLERIKALVNGTEEDTSGNALFTDGFGVAPYGAINAILAMNGLTETNPIPQSSSSNSKLKGVANSQFAALAELALTDSNGSKSINNVGAKNLDQTVNFSPSIVINSQNADEKAIRNWWNRYVDEEYSKSLLRQ